MPNFIAISSRGAFLQICEILRFCDFIIVLSCPGYTFFLATSPRSDPWTDFNDVWLKWRAQGYAFCGFGWRSTIIRGSKAPKISKKKAWLGIFQPKWQHYKIVISATGNIESIPNFDRVIEPHSWLRGWSRITKLIFNMADSRHIAKCWKRYNSPMNGPIWMKLGWSHPIMSPICSPWCGCYGNGRCLATEH